jgi:hypothetical protein
MNDLYYNIIIIVLVLVLFLAYILIAYFYTSYSNYKEDVDDNFEKTKNYINTSISKIDDNIRSSITENNTKINNTSNYINDINKKVSRVDLKSEDNYYEVKNSLNNYSSNLNKTNLLIDSNTININKFDTNIKQFIQYKSNGTTINEAIYNYQFGVSPNLSLDLLRNVNAISGMTIETDNISNFRLCDKNKNCMDMNINNKGLNIFPTNSTNNTTDNILIYDKNKEKVLAKFDLKNRGIYLGGEDENAGMYIQDSNVYVKKLNIINNSDKYASIKTLYDKNNKGQIQSYNTYPFELDDINNKTEINGIYSIIKGTETPPQNEIIINFKCSNNIPSGTTLSFNIQELSNTSTTDIIITSIETIPTSIISSATLNTNIIKIITSTIIYKHRNYRIKIKNVEFNINSIYTEPNITNIINHRL